MTRRFAIALSFPGEYRRFARSVATALAKSLTKERVFFDDWYQPELVGRSLDLKLTRIYSKDADLVVPFFSKYYEKPWCAVEWDAMRVVLFERRKDDAVVPVELDGTKIPGWEVIDVGIRRKQQTATQIANLLLAIYEQREQRRATRKGEPTPEPVKRVAVPKRAKAAPKRRVLPTVVLMDSTLPAVVYDRETRKAGGTNADDITRIVADLPITTLKETTSLMWQRDEQVLRLNPDVIVMHFSAFYDETSPDDGDHRLENFLTYMSASKAIFLIYSRMTDAQRRWLDGWLNGVVSRTPALLGRIEVLRIAPGPKATFRDPDLARTLKLRLKTLVGL